jgi:hypothetical protein
MNIDKLVRDADPAALITIPDPPHLGANMAPGRASQRRRRVPALAAGLAAGILLVGGTAYGLTAARGGSGVPPGPATAGGTALTAVHGCPRLYALGGTLKRVNGTSLVIKAFRTGHLVTVTTSASTEVSRQQAGTLADITDEKTVVVFGTGSSRGSLAAQNVLLGVLRPPLPHLGHPHLGAPRPLRGHPGQAGRVPGVRGFAIGTVTDARPGRFKVITLGGIRRVTVTTSRSTTVFTQARVGLSQLRTAAFTDVVGHPARDGTLAAGAVQQGSLMPQFVGPLPGLGCSSSVIATAMFLTGG